MTYEELLERHDGLYEHVVRIDPSQLGDSEFAFNAVVNVDDPRGLKDVKAEAVDNLGMRTSIDENNVNNYDSNEFNVKFFNPDSNPDDSLRFTIKFDVRDRPLEGELILCQGFFVHFLAPSALKAMTQHKIFVLDTSLSMHGGRLDGLKKAMNDGLRSSRSSDSFTIVTFNWRVQLYNEGKAVKATKANVDNALNYVKGLTAHGSTNINGGLLKALELEQRADFAEESVVVFLTDGQPTEGVTRPESILKNVKEANVNKVSIYGLAFGSEADFGLVRAISAGNRAFARVFADNSDNLLGDFFKSLTPPVMSDLNVDYDPNVVDLDSVTRNSIKSLREGREFIIAGRIKPAGGRHRLLAQVRARSARGVLALQAEPDYRRTCPNIVQRLWAFLSVKEFLKEQKNVLATIKDKTLAKTLSEKLEKKAMGLSLEYEFVTPLTSLVVNTADEESIQRKSVDSRLVEDFCRYTFHITTTTPYPSIIREWVRLKKF